MDRDAAAYQYVIRCSQLPEKNNSTSKGLGRSQKIALSPAGAWWRYSSIVATVV